jgi:hypothetical protein
MKRFFLDVAVFLLALLLAGRIFAAIFGYNPVGPHLKWPEGFLLIVFIAGLSDLSTWAFSRWRRNVSTRPLSLPPKAEEHPWVKRIAQ